MENRSKHSSYVFGQRTRSGPTRPEERGEQDPCEQLVRAACEELRRITIPGTNIILNGQERHVRRLLASVLADAPGPVFTWVASQPLALPVAQAGSTLVLYDVGTLPIQDQIRLFEYVGRTAGRVRIVCTTPTPLLPRVRAGAFIDTLYYRLNTVYVDLSATPEAA